jgi:hypothetical protein
MDVGAETITRYGATTDSRRVADRADVPLYVDAVDHRLACGPGRAKVPSLKWYDVNLTQAAGDARPSMRRPQTPSRSARTTSSADRVPPYRLIAGGALVASLWTALIALSSDDLVTTTALRGGTGVAVACVYSVGLKVMSSSFSRRRGLAVSVRSRYVMAGLSEGLPWTPWLFGSAVGETAVRTLLSRDCLRGERPCGSAPQAVTAEHGKRPLLFLLSEVLGAVRDEVA